MDWKKVVNEVNKNVGDKYDTGVDSLLDRMGLEPKRSAMDVIFPMLGVFGAGIAVGASLGVLFAPKPGDDLRHELRESIEDMRYKSKEKISDATEKVTEGNSRTGTTTT